MSALIGTSREGTPQTRWRERNKEKEAARLKEFYLNNKETVKARAKKYNESDARKKWKEDNKEYTKLWNKEYWLKVRKDKKPHLKYNYGVTKEQYDAMVITQAGMCLGCGKHQSEYKRPLNVDHCHRTGKVRGLLCQKCNTIIGMADDNLVILETLIKYLKNE